MRQLKSDDRRFTGLEAAIVLIAFVVVAAVFSYVVYGYRFAEPASTNIQIGNVYGLATVPSSGINEIRFYISLAPNAPSIDLTQTKIVFSTPATSPVTLSHGTTASTSVFTSRLEGTENSVDAIDPKQLIAIDFLVANVSANTTITFEMRPPVGVLSFNRTAPATITNTNIL